MRTKIGKKDKNKALVICGHCGEEQIVDANELTEPVDAFGDFIDIYFKEQEFDRLIKRAAKLQVKRNFSELAAVYSYLGDICAINYKEAMRAFEETKDEEHLENAQKWKGQEDEYQKLSDDTYEKLRLKELEDGIDDDQVYEDPDDQQFQMMDGKSKGEAKMKKGRTLDDIVDDKGFLEF